MFRKGCMRNYENKHKDNKNISYTILSLNSFLNDFTLKENTDSYKRF